MARLREHEEHCPFHDYETHQAVLRQHHQNGGGGDRWAAQAAAELRALACVRVYVCVVGGRAAGGAALRHA